MGNPGFAVTLALRNRSRRTYIACGCASNPPPRCRQVLVLPDKNGIRCLTESLSK